MVHDDGVPAGGRTVPTGRLEKDAEAIRQTLSCRDWTVARDIQARWMEETLRDYNAEMSKLTGLYAKTH